MRFFKPIVLLLGLTSAADWPSIHDFGESTRLLVQDVSSQDPTVCLSGLLQLRRSLCTKNMGIVANCAMECNGFLSRLHWILAQTGDEVVTHQVEAAWILTNVVKVSSEHAACVYNSPDLLNRIKSLAFHPNAGLRNQIVWLLGNICGDSHTGRVFVLQEGFAEKFIRFISAFPITDHLLWAVTNFTLGGEQGVECVAAVIPFASTIVAEPAASLEIKCAALGILNNIAEKFQSGPGMIIHSGFHSPAVQLLFNQQEVEMQLWAGRLLFSLVATSDLGQTQLLLDGNLLTAFDHVLFCSEKPELLVMVLVSLDNIAAESAEFLIPIMAEGIFSTLVKLLLRTENSLVFKEAMGFLTRILRNDQAVKPFLYNTGNAQAFCDLLTQPAALHDGTFLGRLGIFERLFGLIEILEDIDYSENQNFCLYRAATILINLTVESKQLTMQLIGFMGTIKGLLTHEGPMLSAVYTDLLTNIAIDYPDEVLVDGFLSQYLAYLKTATISIQAIRLVTVLAARSPDNVSELIPFFGNIVAARMATPEQKHEAFEGLVRMARINPTAQDALLTSSLSALVIATFKECDSEMVRHSCLRFLQVMIANANDHRLRMLGEAGVFAFLIDLLPLPQYISSSLCCFSALSGDYTNALIELGLLPRLVHLVENCTDQAAGLRDAALTLVKRMLTCPEHLVQPDSLLAISRLLTLPCPEIIITALNAVRLIQSNPQHIAATPDSGIFRVIELLRFYPHGEIQAMAFAILDQQINLIGLMNSLNLSS